ncbi:MAG: hypothetical protein WD080_10150, partial [Egibacteraceae bacterium]
ATDPIRDPAPPPGLRSGAAPGPTAQAEAAAGHLVVRAVDGLEVRAHPAAGRDAVNGRDAVAGQDAVAVRADATGRAGFPNLAPGRWTVRAPGHETATVEVAAGAVAELSLRATALR